MKNLVVLPPDLVQKLVVSPLEEALENLEQGLAELVQKLVVSPLEQVLETLEWQSWCKNWWFYH